MVANTTTAPLANRRLSKSVSVRTDSPELPSLTLRFSVKVEAPIVFKPNNRLVVSTVEGEEGRRRVLLHRIDGGELEILSADTGDPSLDAVASPVDEKERRNDFEALPGDVWLDLVVPADAPLGSKTGKLRLTTNHPAARSFDVPYAMRVRPLIESRPVGARLWPSPSGSGDGYSAFLTLNRNGGGSFAISDARSSHPEIFSAAVVSTEAGQRQILRVDLSEELSPGGVTGTLEGWIEITTDIPERSPYQLPVLVGDTRDATRRPFPTQRRE